MQQHNKTRHNQTGATLIVSLVILAVVTVLGIASIRSSNLELKMAASQRDHSVAFQMAEAALKMVERKITVEERIRLTQLVPACGENSYCFQKACSTAGYCFGGIFEGDVSLEDCSLASESKEVTQYWQETKYWDDAPTIDVPSVSDTTAKNKVHYLVEFMCFVKNENSGAAVQEGVRATMLPLFRISVLAEGEAKRSKVMLQSVFRGNSVI